MVGNVLIFEAQVSYIEVSDSRNSGMVIYEIIAKVEPELVESFVKYMKERHIPDLLKTGFFDSARIELLEKGIFRMRYQAKNMETLDGYLSEKAELLRSDFAKHFPEGVEVARDIREE